MHNFTDGWELPGVVWKFDSFTRPSRKDSEAKDPQKQALTVEAGCKGCIRAMPGISTSSTSCSPELEAALPQSIRTLDFQRASHLAILAARLDKVAILAVTPETT